MTCLPPDYTERRGDRVLLLWADLPYWMVVDRTAARFIEALAGGKSPSAALDAVGGGRGFALERDAGAVLTSLRRAGVLGGRRPRPPRERIESISVNVTNRCNLRCRFCYNRGRKGNGSPDDGVGPDAAPAAARRLACGPSERQEGDGGRDESRPYGRRTADGGRGEPRPYEHDAAALAGGGRPMGRVRPRWTAPGTVAATRSGRSSGLEHGGEGDGSADDGVGSDAAPAGARRLACGPSERQEGDGGRDESRPYGRRTADSGRGEPRPYGRGEELGAEEMIGALESVRRQTARGASLVLLGGEPLLEPAKTLALAAYARRRGLQAIMSTNGLLVDEAFAREAARCGLDCQVSVDGAGAASHEAIRGAGTFEAALQAVRTLRAAGAHTIMSMVVHADNAHELPDYLRLAREVGADEARFIPLKRLGGGDQCRPPDLPALVRLTAETLLAEPELRRLVGRDHFSILANTCRLCSPRQTCGTGSQTFLLDADGTVYPCLNLAAPEFAAGSVRDEPLGRIWSASPVLRDLRPRVRLPARPQACGQCIVRHWCLGGCRGETYAHTGRLDAPGVTCRGNRTSILETMWILSTHPELVQVGPRYC